MYHPKYFNTTTSSLKLRQNKLECFVFSKHFQICLLLASNSRILQIEQVTVSYSLFYVHLLIFYKVKRSSLFCLGLSDEKLELLTTFNRTTLRLKCGTKFCVECHRGILRRKYHCTVDLLFNWFGFSCMTTDNFLQNRLIQTSQTGGQLYSDTSPFSIPWCHNLIIPPSVVRQSVTAPEVLPRDEERLGE